MSQVVEIKVPDIGDFQNVDVIEVLVKAGDSIEIDQSLIILETDKATMEVPATAAGVVREIKIRVGSKVSEGDVIVTVESADAAQSTDTAASGATLPEEKEEKAADGVQQSSGSVITLTVPDIGDFQNVDVIEVLVKAGDSIEIDQSLITLETDKATMEVPATAAGVVKTVKVQVGSKVSQGDAIAEIEAAGTIAASVSAPPQTAQPLPEKPEPQAEKAVPEKSAAAVDIAFGTTPDDNFMNRPHAGPAVRKLARELGVDLRQVKGSARNRRIVADDVKAFVKQQMTQNGGAPQSAALGGGLDLLPWPQVDFSKFGETETVPLARIKKISGQNLARNWVMIPHVTQHDDADMTELEAFRKTLNKELERDGIKISPLVFIIKACVRALQQFPEFNASLDGENLILKKYFHIGFAADTPNGLVVPVIRDADKKTLTEIAQDLADLSAKARAGKLKPQEMQGACFTVSSLGGIGGTYFTPIINAPEVAILGVCRSEMRPLWDGGAFVPRLICPLSLSYDHRVIDGAAACRFTAYLCKILADFRRVLV